MAQVREWIKGCAGAVMGEMEARLLGRVVLFGKRMGEVKGLNASVACLQREECEHTDS